MRTQNLEELWKLGGKYVDLNGEMVGVGAETWLFN